MQNTYDLLSEILIDQFEVRPEEIRPDATLEELELDSLFLVELSLIVKRDLKVEIGETGATPRSSVEEIVQLIDGLLKPVA